MNAEEKKPSKFRKLLGKLGSEFVLGSLVAVLSVLTAFAAFQGALADNQESDKNVEGQKQLTESNSMYLEANQFVIYDYTMYDGWYINQDSNPDNADYYKASFSDSLNAALERNADEPFDDAYYTEMYKDASDTYDEANTAFDEANTAGEKGINLQAVVMVFAVGLALAAYGSLMPEEKAIRILFAIVSITALVAGLVRLLTA